MIKAVMFDMGGTLEDVFVDETSELAAIDRLDEMLRAGGLDPQVGKKELKRRVETAEKKIDELQQALDEASAELFNPTPQTDFAEANRKVRTLQFEIDRYTADWEEAATELEALS